MMNSSCFVTANPSVILSFFTVGGLLTIVGTILNIFSCLLFWRTKSLARAPYAVFIVALSLADIIKLTAEYSVHLVFLFIHHPYFVCSISWFLTMTSENASYAFLCALGIERNLKVWTINRRYLITQQRARSITIGSILFVCLYNHPFLFWPRRISYCYFSLINRPLLFSCQNAHYQAYGLSFSLTDLLFIENVGLNNFILPLVIISTNIVLIVGLRRRAKQRRTQLGVSKPDDWRERSVLLYMLLSSLSFLILTSPVGFLGAWMAMRGQPLSTSNLALVLDLMEIFHHCSHFPILLATSSILRAKMVNILCPSRIHQPNFKYKARLNRLHSLSQPINQHETCLSPPFSYPISQTSS